MRRMALVTAGLFAGFLVASCDGGPASPSADQLSYDQGWEDGFQAGQSSCPLPLTCPDCPEQSPCPDCPSENDAIEEFLMLVADECRFGSSLEDSPRGIHGEIMNRLWNLHRRGYC